MPSSPTFNDYTRRFQRFVYKGISLLPQDLVNLTGKAAYASNIRSYTEGTVTVRYGTVRAATTPAPDAIHTIVRLNDPTPLGVSSPETRIVGAGTSLYRQVVGSPIGGGLDSGYSGNPLTSVVTAPPNSPRPFAYMADSVRMRKVDSDGTVTPIGVAPPTSAPSAQLAEPQYSDLINLMDGGTWVGYGGGVIPTSGPAPIVTRVSTVTTDVLFDSGSDGMASVSVEDFTNITAGVLVEVDGERVVVQEVHPPVSPTTIAGIVYDSGVSGLCTIQPEGSFSVGQIEAPNPEIIKRRYENLGIPVPPQVTVTRTIDFPVNSLVLLGGVEVVRILSVAIGPDNVQSFRCFTFGTFGASATISGVPSFRTWFATSKSVGDAVEAEGISVSVTPLSTEDENVIGVQNAIPDADWSRVGDRAAQPEDIIRLGVRVSLMGFVEAVRLMLDMQPNEEDLPTFSQNYYFYEWRASDLISAIQASGQSATDQVIEAQTQAVERGQVTQQYDDQYGIPRREDAFEIRPPDLRTPGEVVGRVDAPKDGLVSIGSGLSRQLALGNDVWITLECRVGDLSRVGTDTTKTLGAITNACVYAQITGTTNEITFSASDPYIIGGYGPDVGPTLPPYVYRYRYRAVATGVVSYPSPTMRAGVSPRRGRVELSASGSSDSQVDLIDWFRFGGALARWTYVGSSPNSSPAFDDDMQDSQIDGGETLRVDLFQPWPTSDIPRTGTCDVVGTAVIRTGGDSFNTNWSADSLIVVNGRTTQLYGPPTSADRLEVIDNCGLGSGVEFRLPQPTLLATPLPAMFGGPINNVWFTFAVGDPQDPSAVHWTHGNDPESTSDAFVLIVSSPSEPLLNGCFYDGFPYVFSTERLYRLIPTFGDITAFRTQETACTRGLWSPWALASTPYGIFFLSKDGIYVTTGGAEAQSITNPDLQVLFPQEGGAPEAVRGLNPIDFSQPDRLRLAWVDQMLFFDYVDTTGEGHTLVYEPSMQRWTPDVYPLAWGGVRVRLEEPGEGAYTHLLGFGDGFLNQVDANQLTDVDEILPWAIWTSWEAGDDPRAFKQWGDAVLDMHPGSSVNGITVTPVIDNGNLGLVPSVLGIGGDVRETYLVEVTEGIGELSRNFGLQITGFCELCDIQRPLLYLWEPSWLFKQVSIARRATDWEDLGYKGAKFVQGVVIRANTYNETKLVAVQFDGPNSAPQTALTLSMLHNGEQSITYPLASTGWTPFIGELVRLHGSDDVEWSLLDWRWIWEPAPELATQWETQDTTFDQPGYGSLRDAVLAVQSFGPTNLRVWHDLGFRDYTIPSTGGVYQRVYTPFVSAKGKAYRFRWTGDTPFRVFKRDVSMRCQPWGQPGGYRIVMPFGGPHREDGAGV